MFISFNHKVIVNGDVHVYCCHPDSKNLVSLRVLNIIVIIGFGRIVICVDFNCDHVTALNRRCHGNRKCGYAISLVHRRVTH